MITFTVTLDEETGEVIDEDVAFRGPHPQGDNLDFFCEVMPEALGIA